jgi:hypothetical protein
VTEGFELGGNGGADFTGAEDGDVHGPAFRGSWGFNARERAGMRVRVALFSICARAASPDCVKSCARGFSHLETGDRYR